MPLSTLHSGPSCKMLRRQEMVPPLVALLFVALPHKPWSVALGPHVGGTYLVAGGSVSGARRWLLSGGATVDVGFRPIDFVRVTGLVLGTIHQNNTANFAGGQSGLAAVLTLLITCVERNTPSGRTSCDSAAA